MVIFRERYEGDAEKFESALMKAKKGIKEACEIFEEMKDEFSERGGGGGGYSQRSGYGERYSNRSGGSYRRRDDDEWDDMYERRSYRRREY